MKGIELGEEGARRLAAAVKSARSTLGITQKEVAARSGVFATPTLQTIESASRTNFSRRTLTGLCRALNWTDDSIELVIAGHAPVARPTAYGDDVVSALEEMRRALAKLEQAVAPRPAD